MRLGKILFGGLAVVFALVGTLVSLRNLAAIAPAISTASTTTSTACGPGLSNNRTSTTTQRPPLRTPPPPRYAIVHLIDGWTPIYEAALLASAHRAAALHERNIHAPCSLDLVVLVDDTVDATGHEHPYIRYLPFSSQEIRAALRGKGYQHWHTGTHYKLAAMNLTDYDKVVFLDLDYLLRQPLTRVLEETTPPAMVPWGDFPKLDYNSGFHILKPDRDMYADALETLRNLGQSGTVVAGLKEASTRERLSRQPPPDPSQLAGFRGDQELLFAFYDVLPATRHKWGPIHSLPYRLNAREETVAALAHHLLGDDPSVAFRNPGLGPQSKREDLFYFQAGLQHLYGGFGHDGFGHDLSPPNDEADGRFGLVGLHFSTRKPWNEKYFLPAETSPVGLPANNHTNATNATTTLSPRELCPDWIHHVDWWEAALAGFGEALGNTHYGHALASPKLLQFFGQHKIVRECFAPQWEVLDRRLRLLQKGKVACPEPADCTNKHCRSRPDGVDCGFAPGLAPYRPLVVPS